MKRAEPDAKSDDFGAVWTLLDAGPEAFQHLEACKTRCKKRRFWRDLDAGPEQVRRRHDSLKRAKPDAKSDDFGAVWTQVRSRSGGVPTP